MSTTHTPGPWHDYTEPHGTRHILPCPQPTLDTVQICTFGGTAYRSKSETDANARLLAAAPDLLAALERLSVCVAGMDRFSLDENFEAAQTQARAIIARVGGADGDEGIYSQHEVTLLHP
jgi:hypothetical protein